MKIRELMTRDIVSCGPSDSLNRAAQLMWERDCGSIPVVEADGRVAGMITDRDICMAAYTGGAAISAVRVSDIMSRDVKSCAPDDDVAAVSARMADLQVRRIPVVEGGRLAGILSLNDLALAAAGRRPGAPSLAEVGQTLAGICRHRPLQAVAAE